MQAARSDLRRALEHRHLLTKRKPVLERLWAQLEKRIVAGSPHVQQSTTCLQLLLDIDHTLLYTYPLSDVCHKDGNSPGRFPDPDMQQFYDLAQQFYHWCEEAVDTYGSQAWPEWLPETMIDGKRYSMWMPQDDPSNPDPLPVPEFIAPMFDIEGTLTHYILLYGSMIISTMPAESGDQETLVVPAHIRMAVVPAEITLLTYLRYELAAEVDKLRDTPSDTLMQVDLQQPTCGHTEVELYLATAASERYMTKVWQLLEQLLSCEHGGQVFAGTACFRNWSADNYESHAGVKSMKPFALRESDMSGGLICCRLIVDDHIWWWDEKAIPGRCRLLPIMGWNGRWADLDRDDIKYINRDTQKIAFVTCYSGPDVIREPVAPEGLNRLLPEVLHLLDQALEVSDPKLPQAVLSPVAAAAANAVSAVQQAAHDFPRIAALKAKLLLPYGQQLRSILSCGRSDSGAEDSHAPWQLHHRVGQQAGAVKPLNVVTSAVGVAALMPAGGEAASTAGGEGGSNCSSSSCIRQQRDFASSGAAEPGVSEAHGQHTEAVHAAVVEGSPASMFASVADASLARTHPLAAAAAGDKQSANLQHWQQEASPYQTLDMVVCTDKQNSSTTSSSDSSKASEAKAAMTGSKDLNGEQQQLSAEDQDVDAVVRIVGCIGSTGRNAADAGSCAADIIQGKTAMVSAMEACMHEVASQAGLGAAAVTASEIDVMAGCKAGAVVSDGSSRAENSSCGASVTPSKRRGSTDAGVETAPVSFAERLLTPTKLQRLSITSE